MAPGPMPVAEKLQRRGLVADRSEAAVTTAGEAAAKSRRNGAGLAVQADASGAAADERDGGEQGFRVGMKGRVQHGGGWAELHDSAAIHDGDAIGQVPDHADIMADEQQREAELVAQFGKQVEGRGLHGDVEGGDGFVANEELRPAGQRAGDGDPLFLAPPES